MCFVLQESDDEECFKDQEEAEEDEEKIVDADEVEDEKRSTMESSAKTKNSNSSASWVHHLNMGGKSARKYIIQQLGVSP